MQRDGRAGRAVADAPEAPDARPPEAPATASSAARTCYAESPDMIVIATGAKLGSRSRRDELAKDGTKARVVSMPCWELFEAQTRRYRDRCCRRREGARLDRGRRDARLEAVGRRRGDSIWIDHFGAPRPGTIVLEKFGFTVDSVVARALGAAHARRLMNVAVAFDHRGVHLRDKTLETLQRDGHEVIDFGTDSDAIRIDYPDKAARSVQRSRAGAPSGASSSAARASAPPSPRARSPGSGQRSAMTSIPPTRESSTTT